MMARSALVAFVAATTILAMVPPAHAAIAPADDSAAGAMALGKAMMRGESADTTLTAASWVEYETASVTPAGVSDAIITGIFGVPDGSRFGVLTTGDENDAETGPQAGTVSKFVGHDARGARDVTILALELAVPESHNCLSLTLQFLSDEWPEWSDPGTTFNDAFVAEVDANTWALSGGTLNAPDNFALTAPLPGGQPIMVRTFGGAGMSEADAAGTAYDGGTPLYQARTPITPGAHTLYLSTFDSGDPAFDSGTFVDDIYTFRVNDPAVGCVVGISPPILETPVAVPQVQPPIDCAPVLVQFQDLSTWDPTLTAKAEWNFGDGSSVTMDPVARDVSHEYTEAGTFTVTLRIVDDLGQEDTASVIVEVCPPPVPPVVALVSLVETGCTNAPADLHFNDDSAGIGFLRAVWDWGDGSQTTYDPRETQVTHRYTAPGSYVVTYQVFDDNSQSDAAELRFSICSDAQAPGDADQDGVADHQDNCPSVPNQAQGDLDLDGQGDACDPFPEQAFHRDPLFGQAPPTGDRDRDGVLDASDMCPDVPDGMQRDLDGDAVGDACDTDADGDGVEATGDFPDVCPLLPDPSQEDTDNDGLGDACEPVPAPATATSSSSTPGTSTAAPAAGLVALLACLGAGALLRRRA